MADSNPKKRLLTQAALDSAEPDADAALADSTAASTSAAAEAADEHKAKRAHVAARTVDKVERAAAIWPKPRPVGSFGSQIELAQYTAWFQNKALLSLLRNKKQELAAQQTRTRQLESALSAASTTAAHVNVAWAQLLADLRLILRRLGEASAEQTRAASQSALSSVSSFRRLLRSSSQHAVVGGDATGDGGAAVAESADDLAAHLRQRKAEASQLLLAVVEAVERGAKASEGAALADELHAQISAERDRAAALADKLAQTELQLADSAAQSSLLREQLEQAQAQRDRARTALRSQQSMTAVPAAAAVGGDSGAAGAASASSQTTANGATGVPSAELDELREQKADAELRAQLRLEEIEKLRENYRKLEALLMQERVDASAPLPEKVIERSELLLKLREKQAQTDAAYREKVVECNRLSLAQADSQRQHETDVAQMVQQNRVVTEQLSERLRESENTLQRVRGERRAVTLKAAELEVAVAHANEGTASKDKHIAALESYTRALASRVARGRVRGVGVTPAAVAAATSDMVSKAAAGVQADAAVASLEQTVSDAEIATLKRELVELRAAAAAGGAADSSELAKQLAETQANLAAAEETHRVLEAELDTMCEQIEQTFQTSKEYLTVITAKDDVGLKLMTEKAKLKTAVQSGKERIMTLTHQLELAQITIEKDKAAYKEKQAELELERAVGEQRRQLAAELEGARDAANAVELRRLEEDALARQRLDATSKQVVEAKKIIETQVGQAHEMTQKMNRMREQITELNRKLDTWRRKHSAHIDTDEQVAHYRAKSLCKVCHERDVTTVLSKCYHVFCADCIEQNLRDRHRKCPACGIKFGEQDVHRIYIAGAGDD